jgi:hypothetical protein
MTTERTAHQHRRTRVFSREIRTVNFPQRFCQPTTITKYTGELIPGCGSMTTAWLASWAASPLMQ